MAAIPKDVSSLTAGISKEIPAPSGGRVLECASRSWHISKMVPGNNVAAVRHNGLRTRSHTANALEHNGCTEKKDGCLIVS